jgi:hypothetical protein
MHLSWVRHETVLSLLSWNRIKPLFALFLGYFSFEECGDMVNPTIGMEVGETYTFVQADR